MLILYIADRFTNVDRIVPEKLFSKCTDKFISYQFFGGIFF